MGEIKFGNIVIGTDDKGLYVNVYTADYDLAKMSRVVTGLGQLVPWLPSGLNIREQGCWRFLVQSDKGMVSIGIEDYDLNNDEDLWRAIRMLHSIIERM